MIESASTSDDLTILSLKKIMKTLPFILIALFLFAGLVWILQSKNTPFWATVRNRFVSFKRDWWIKVTTDSPLCTYYFGPFDTIQEAKYCQGGYVEDLENEGASGISAKIQWTQPQTLTLEESY